jgi:hypothetical protein
VLALLKNAPTTPEEWDRYGWSHRVSHRLIREAIQKKSGVNLTDYILRIDAHDFPGFLSRNQQSHLEASAQLGVVNFDLGAFDPNDLGGWVDSHYLAHYFLENAAGVGS